MSSHPKNTSFYGTQKHSRSNGKSETMTGKRPGEAIVNASAPNKLATLNPNWAQLQAKLNVRHRRNTPLKSDAKIPLKIQTSEASADKPEASSCTLLPILPVNSDSSLTDAIAMDCEMVGVGDDGRKNALARVTLVNVWGNAIYDEYVRPLEFVTNFRSWISGVRAHDLRKAEDLWNVQKKVSELIKGRILVGHALHNDLKVLFLSHPKKDIRDTSVYKPLRSKEGRPRALRELAAEILGVKIQEKEHCSVEDARAAMFIYQKFKKDWEKSIREKRKKAKVQANGLATR